MNFLRRFRDPSSWTDLVLAAGVVALILTMLVRISPEVMDLLIAVNIAASVTTLMVALYSAEAVRVTSFPTVLLLLTLFRLALNVSSTRLVLLDGDAGSIITAFGEFVVGGDYFVGFIVFVVLALIQFLVIAKGAERVAEVAARFTLDAMPGKQMSIDADLRNGLIDEREAVRRRDSMDKEARLYGAMDGAMKFVKGDAIAGIVISIVNIVGGLIVGLSRGMDMGHALQLYTLLTIGDGLVTQIPALLVSVSAGLVVTRVGDGKSGGGRLAHDVLGQVMENPRTIALSAGMLLLVAVTGPWTGFPPLPFLVLAAMLFGGYLLHRRRTRSPLARAEALLAQRGPGGGDKAAGKTEPARTSFEPPAIVIEVHPALDAMFFQVGQDAAGAMTRKTQPELVQRLRGLQDSLSQQLGIRLPPILLASEGRRLAANGYAFVLHGGLAATAALSPDYLLLMCDVGSAQQRGLDPLPVVLPGTRIDACQVPLQQSAAAAAAGLFPLPHTEVAVRHLGLVLRRNAADFLGIQEVSDLLELLKETRRDLVDAVVPGKLKVFELTEVLQYLLREEVPIRDLRAVLEALAQWAGRIDPETGKPLTAEALAEVARRHLRRSLCDHFSQGERTLRCYALDRQLEARLRAAMHGNPLAPHEQRAVVQAASAAIDPTLHVDGNPILVVSADLRRFARSLLHRSLPELAVFCHEELVPEFGIEDLGRVRLPDAAAAAGPAPTTRATA